LKEGIVKPTSTRSHRGTNLDGGLARGDRRVIGCSTPVFHGREKYGPGNKLECTIEVEACEFEALKREWLQGEGFGFAFQQRALEQGSRHEPKRLWRDEAQGFCVE
jgi:hypothetical protein